MKKLALILLMLVFITGCNLPTDLPETSETEEKDIKIIEEVKAEPAPIVEEITKKETEIIEDEVKLLSFEHRSKREPNMLFWDVTYERGEREGIMTIYALSGNTPGIHVNIAKIHVSEVYRLKPKVLDDKIYFLNKGTLYALDLETGGLGSIEIRVATEVALREHLEANPDIDPNSKWGISIGHTQETIFDVHITDDTIVYLARSCEEWGYCYLGMFDRKTRQSRLISDDLFKQKKGKAMFSSFKIQSYDPANNKIILSLRGGDGGGAHIFLYEVSYSGDFNHMNEEGFPIVLTQKAKVFEDNCEYVGTFWDTHEQCEAERKLFKEFWTAKPVTCGTHSFIAKEPTREDDRMGIVKTNPYGQKSLMENVHILGCRE